MFVYRSRMAFSSITEFSGSGGVNTWGAVWPGLLWGLQWVELGQDVVAGQSLQLQTPLTLLTSWNSHITFSVPQNRSNWSWWFTDTYRMCFFSVPGRFEKKSKEKRCLDIEGDKKAASRADFCCYLLWFHDYKLLLSCRKRASPILITHRWLCIHETVQHFIYYDCYALCLTLEDNYFFPPATSC